MHCSSDSSQQTQNICRAFVRQPNVFVVGPTLYNWVAAFLPRTTENTNVNNTLQIVYYLFARK